MSMTFSANRVTQGRWGTQVLAVLIAALMLAAGAWAIAEVYTWSDSFVVAAG